MITQSNSSIVPSSLQVDPYVDFQTPVGTKWIINHIAITCDQPLSGKIYANVFIDNVFWCGSSTGAGDTADGTPLVLMPSQIFRVLWIPDATYIPVFASTQVNLSVNLIVDQGNA